MDQYNGGFAKSQRHLLLVKYMEGPVRVPQFVWIKDGLTEVITWRVVGMLISIWFR